MLSPFLLLALARAAASTAFDFVIVGGGPAGLLVANRLSADPNMTVAVIEAGDSAYNNPNVTRLPQSIAEFSPGIGTQVDWRYTSTPQKYASNGTLPYTAGKALGGSTVIYGMTYVRAEKTQIDAWEKLGNDGLTWDKLWPYYLSQEKFQIPDETQKKNGATFEESAHGFDGQVSVGFTPYLTGQGAFEILKQTTEALGYPVNVEVNNGDMSGTSTWPSMLNTTEAIRGDAARAYYWGVADARPNLHVFLNTTANKIVWGSENSTNGCAIASGLEVVTVDGKSEIIRANREVIVAAGSIRSPAILEHSGVGNPAILEPLGIQATVRHPSVGTNLMDQPANGISYSSSTNWTGYPAFGTYLTASDLFRDDLAAITEELRSNISAYAKTIVGDTVPDATTIEIQEQLLKHQIDLIFHPNSTVPLAELLWIPYETAIVCQFWNLLPLSRGSIHINSSDSSAQPAINPNFFQLPIDMYVQAAIAVRIREFFATAPLSQNVIAEVGPGFETVPQNTSWKDAAWATWIEQTYASNSHPVSTCPMMSREFGGVVDTEGKVYGTENVRVVDASVFPTQISGHLTATVYAIAARIADAILSKK
jgi:choline dehydrogenase-like flavoprotein